MSVDQAGVTDRLPGSEASCSRTDEATGVTELIALFGSGKDSLFACTYLPPAVSKAGVVICSPLEAEMRTTYRREVLLARMLAARGVAVQRFHYRGTGNSLGAPDSIGFEDMRQDVHRAAERLQELSGVSMVGLIGTRFGALVAASAAMELPEAPLVLWEPVTSGEPYLRSILRARLMQDMRSSSAPRRSTDQLIEELHQVGWVDVVGYPIRASLYQTAGSKSLSELVGSSIRQILLIQLGASRDLRSEYRDLVETWRARGCPVDVHTIQEENPWWFGYTEWLADETSPIAGKLLDVTASWVEARMRDVM